MRLWLSLALLGLLLLPACNPKPSEELANNAADNAQGADNSTSIKGYIMPENNIPNPVVSAEWFKFRDEAKEEFNAVYPEFPNLALQVLKDKYDADKVEIANQNLGYFGRTLNDVQCTTLDSYYSALFTLESMAAVGLNEKNFPKVVGLLQKTAKTAEPIVKPPADLDSDLAVCGNHIKRQVLGIGEFYANDSAIPTRKVLAFNKSAIKLLDLIQQFGSYSSILSEAETALQEAEAVIAERSVDVSSFRCTVKALEHIVERLRKEGDTATGSQPGSSTANAVPVPAEPATTAAATEPATATATEPAPAATAPAATATPESAAAPNPATAAAEATANPDNNNSPNAGSGKIQYPLNQTITTKSGLQITIQRAGHGENCKSGQMVSVHYQGTFTDGQLFDSSYTRKLPLEFPLGLGYVIDGWEEGVVGMQVGEKRHLVIPPSLGYGSQGSGPIPANATLIFDVELLRIE